MNFDIDIENDKNDSDIDYFFIIYKIIWFNDYYYEIDYINENKNIDDIINYNIIFWLYSINLLLLSIFFI